MIQRVKDIMWPTERLAKPFFAHFCILFNFKMANKMHIKHSNFNETEIQKIYIDKSMGGIITLNMASIRTKRKKQPITSLAYISLTNINIQFSEWFEQIKLNLWAILWDIIVWSFLEGKLWFYFFKKAQFGTSIIRLTRFLESFHSPIIKIS